MTDASSSPRPRSWRGDKSAAPSARRPASPRRGKAAAVVAVILLLAGTIAGVLYWIQPIAEPHFVAVWIDQYQDPRIPVNAWAAQDRQALLDAPWQEKNAFARQERHLLLAELRGLEARADRPLVVYLGVHAVVGEDGEAYVLPGDARLDQPATWVPLREVLRLVRAGRAEHKLLILDVMRPLTAPELGLLTNDVAARVHAAAEEAVRDDPRLLVLCACAPGQVTWDSEELRQSAFGHYLRQGLSDRADGGKRDGRVSARELAAFVGARVDRWAEQNRAARQTPVLLGSAPDFPLVAAGQPEDEELPPAEPTPDWLRAGWALLNEWRAAAGPRADAAAYRELAATLLRAERHWRGGTEPDRIRTVVQGAADRFQRQRDERAAVRREPRSLAEAAAQGRKPPDLADGDLRARFRDLAALEARIQAAGPNDKESAAKDREKLAAGQKEFLKRFEGKPLELGWALFEAAAGQPVLRPEHVRCAGDLLALFRAEKPGNGLPSLEEVQLLQRLAEWGRAVKNDWPGDAVRDALQTVREAGQANLADARILPWVRAAREAAANKRREGEGLLLDRGPGSWTKAQPLLAESLREYRAVNRAIRTLDEAHRTLDEALALLPGYAPYLEHDRNMEGTWAAAVETAGGLRDLLARPEDAGTGLTDVLKKTDDRTTTLREQLNRLAQPLGPDRLKKMIAQADHAGPAAWHELNAVRDCPWLGAADREALAKAARSLSERLHRATAAQEQAEDRAGRPTPPLPAFDRARAERQERERALVQARTSLLLLKLAGWTEAGGLEQALERAAADSDNAAHWQRLSRELRQAWAGR